MKASDIKFYLDELQSEECACGEPKKRGKSFCYRCYTSLPGTMQRDLWLKIRNGYEEAYDNALTWLEL